MHIYQIGEEIKKKISFTQEDLDLFSKLSKDLNPIHSETYANTHHLKGALVQGMLAAIRFGEIFGTVFPGPGTINLERNMMFINALYTGCIYEMIIKLTDIDLIANIGTFSLSLIDENGRMCVSGKTKVKNSHVFTSENYNLQKNFDKQTIIDIIKLPNPTAGRNTSLHNSLLNRRSKRIFKKDEINIQELSNLLWAANGVTKIKKNENGENIYLHTNPTANNHQEVEVYVLDSTGIFFYNSIKNQLEKIKSGDFRGEISSLLFFKKAPISILLVSNQNKIIHYKSEYKINRYSNMDIGYVSQNIYLYCSANNLSTCACDFINFDKLNEILDMKDRKVMLVHPIGIGKEYYIETEQ